jgi:hypothetical protein
LLIQSAQKEIHLPMPLLIGMRPFLLTIGALAAMYF